jgi:hypothetical protein
MILPSKHLRENQALIGLGAVILRHLDDGRSVSELWERSRLDDITGPRERPMSFDWFVLSLTLLYAMDAIELERGIVRPRRVQ